ncbi:hypothetical protein LR48_Vigan04g079000 [Vigna angularis]|uniref:Uncharacterized protein n=1 Tax=Phaseolus angularis TaxID=3914 RepID=A0A0L9UDG7_PHAAN|nr:hypothetical protein LR48_Vigan04g079000 [Vigna angularis]
MGTDIQDENEMETESGEDYEDAEKHEEGYDNKDCDEGLLLDEQCIGLKNISVNENGCGKHKRFVYDSEDELVAKVVESCGSFDVMHLKRFQKPRDAKKTYARGYPHVKFIVGT